MTELNDVTWSDEIGQELQGDFEQADAGQGWHRIGKTDIGLTRFIKWSSGQPSEITYEEWKRTPVGQRGHDFKITVDIAEFDQRAKDEGWNYERRVTFKGRDWWQIFVPALEKVFGKSSMDAKNYMSTLNQIRGQYVDWQDVPQAPDKNGNVPTNEATGKPYTTCKLFKVFASKEEAQAAYNALGVGENNDTGGSSTSIYPAAWDGSVDDMIAHAKTNPDNLDHAGLAEQLMLTVDGVPANTAGGQEVDVKLVLSRILDVPEPMIKL